MARTAKTERNTRETQIELELNLDGSGKAEVSTGVGFLDHMLDHLAKHSLCDLTLRARGDTEVDDHHTVEDVAICLGQTLREALQDKAGIARYGSATVPMDEALAQVAIDLSGRSALVFRANFSHAKIGTFDTQLVEEFCQALAREAACSLHVVVAHGGNDHHIAEAIFKALAQALRQAKAIDPDRRGDVPSTKGKL
jgi:imidazoleglycerol-phosphate dehydratase